MWPLTLATILLSAHVGLCLGMRVERERAERREQSERAVVALEAFLRALNDASVRRMIDGWMQEDQARLLMTDRPNEVLLLDSDGSVRRVTWHGDDLNAFGGNA